MGYDLHITRADHWWDHAMYPISLEEWIAVAEAEPRLRKHSVGAGRPPAFTFPGDDGDTGWTLGWRESLITIWKAHDIAAELAVIAQKLGARLVGDDGEEYHADGTSTPWIAPRPILLDRPLHLHEAAKAWEAMLERQDGFQGYGPLPHHAVFAFGSFREFAGREVDAADVPDADGLLYQYGPAGQDGESVFILSLVRQLATDADGGLARVECRLDFGMTPDLAALGSFHEWWFPESGTSRGRFFEALGARPENKLINSLTPSAVCFSTDSVC
ncbi:hypothetical protein KDK95_08795 [Actinospica sp. MGRD01-02]|uniref:Uncharacterized protein n=1 Tax=Actinospica acidithermotolerans TaxID=2828514 RepID=A0A941E8D4_9ACTN|nr:hypothetical protein [Actinospica acidithermotolerans]MBR7826397.1 hypothetical protein [Actinospica acidithermotolerans]